MLPIRPMLLLSATTLPAAALAAVDSPAAYQRFGAALDAAAQHGIRRIEEVEIDRRGRVEVEGITADGRELHLHFDADGSLLRERTERTEPADDDAIDIDAMRRVLGWLQAQHPGTPEQLAADDGLVEIELRDADRREVEMTVDPQSLRVLGLEADGDLRDFMP
ncbi:hypothetical protein [Sinimarinibacterium thermocellulolyticum]|uniref:PepSY domain-containing protein n=1 Tax=Sinimarinibacterium thermocellulolyticum TaxID=3170016 RepID=A0ABV2AC10_9GAMM